MTRTRLQSLDFLKCVFIILMVVFHLAAFADRYPGAKTFVYTFHMSGFLLLSGFLTRTDKLPRDFLRSLGRMAVPYVVMEVGYVLMSAVLPVRDPVTNLSPAFVLLKVFYAPLGPYWYLHTLMLCQLVAYGVMRLPGRLSAEWRMVAVFVAYYVLALGLPTFSFSDAAYFGFGALLAQKRVPFTLFFRASPWALLGVAVAAFLPALHDRGTAGGVLLNYLVICGLLYLYEAVSTRFPRLGRAGGFLGRNTLVVLLFSPIFTMASKALVGPLAFEPTGLLFMAVATGFTLLGSLGVAWMMDCLKVSRWFFGRQPILR